MKPHTGRVVYSLLHVSHEPQTSFTLNYNYLITCMSFPGRWLIHRCLLYFWGPRMAQRLKRLPGMWETRVQSLGREDPLENEMATHSSTLAWIIPWTEEPGRLQSMGSQRVRHDWVTSLLWVTQPSGNLLYNTGSSPWCSRWLRWVGWRARFGGKSKRKGIYIFTYSWFILLFSRN